MNYPFIRPDWPAPANIHALTTLRTEGLMSSFFKYRSDGQLALSDYQQNRVSIQESLNLPSQPIWLRQTHSIISVPALSENRDTEGDSSFSKQANQICVSLTADCLPLLLCDRKGTQVAAIHAGWRGLAHGIIESTLSKLDTDNSELLVWLGPAISQANYEVGNEVRDLFLSFDKEASKAFIPSPQGRWLADLYELARMRLRKKGIVSIYGGNYCTFADPKRFYSYRRDKAYNGNLVSLIWIS